MRWDTRKQQTPRPARSATYTLVSPPLPQILYDSSSRLHSSSPALCSSEELGLDVERPPEQEGGGGKARAQLGVSYSLRGGCLKAGAGLGPSSKSGGCTLLKRAGGGVWGKGV